MVKATIILKLIAAGFAVTVGMVQLTYETAKLVGLLDKKGEEPVQEIEE